MHEWVHQQLGRLLINDPYGEMLSSAIVIAGILIVSLIINWVTKHFLLRSVRTFARYSSFDWDDVLIKYNVFGRIAQIAPAIIIYLTASLPFPNNPAVTAGIQRGVMAYMILIGALIVNAGISSALDIFSRSPLAKGKPIKSYGQVVKLLVYLVTAILIITTLTDSSPWGLLSGLGAMMAIILLVFKDTILGFVSSIQLSTNQMVQIGDWIEMPKYGADGDVIDISLNTVKIRNFDNTITTLPTYALMTDAFKNWRGMSDSGGRRIKRAINLDMNSVKFCTETEIARYEKIADLTEYIHRKRDELIEFNQQNKIDMSVQVNGRRLTNIGTFRAYIRSYLHNHPKIHTGMTRLIRQLPPSAEGLPIEVYVFTNDVNWIRYEDIQADIFDHMLAVLPEFGLRVFQNPTGADFSKISA